MKSNDKWQEMDSKDKIRLHFHLKFPIKRKKKNKV